jgi:hypothetical protein
MEFNMSYRYDTVYKKEHRQPSGESYWVYWVMDANRGPIFVGAWATYDTRHVVTVKS